MRNLSLRLLDMNDRELLALIRDLRNDQGEIETSDIVLALWPDAATRAPNEFKHLMRCVGIRLAWMRRYGVVEQPRKAHWMLTPTGEAILTATIQRAQRRLIEGTEDTTLPAFMAEIGQRYDRAGYTARKIARREFVFATERR